MPVVAVRLSLWYACLILTTRGMIRGAGVHVSAGATTPNGPAHPAPEPLGIPVDRCLRERSHGQGARRLGTNWVIDFIIRV